MPGAQEGSWTKWGVFFTAIGTVLAYLALAAGVKWWPFAPAPDASSAPTPPVLSATTPPVGSVAASFLNATPAASNSPGYNPYFVRIYITGLQGSSVLIRWKTLNNFGLPAGTSGEMTTGTLPYSNDTWRGTVDVTLPSAAFNGTGWHTEFTAYAPNGVEIADIE